MLRKKALKILLIAFAILAALLFAGKLYFDKKAEKFFEQAVHELSHGSYKARTATLKLRLFPLSIHATALEILPVDTVSQSTYYVIRCDTLYGNLSSSLSLIFSKALDITTVQLVHPVVEVYSNNMPGEAQKHVARPLRLVIQDMQLAMLQSFSAFNVKNFGIHRARFRYYTNVAANEYYNINNIELSIRNLVHSKQTGGQVRAEINLSITDPALHYPDSLINISIDKLELSSVQNRFSAQSIALSKRVPGTDSTVVAVQLSALKLSGLHWSQWLKTGLVELDSLSAFNGSTALDFTRKTKGASRHLKKQNIHTTPEDASFIQMLSPLVIHHVQLNQLEYTHRVNRKIGPVSAFLVGDSLGIKDLKIMDTLKPVIQFADLLLNVKNYSGENDSNTHDAGFSGLKITEQSLVLQNFTIHTRNVGPAAVMYDLRIPELILVDFDLMQLAAGRLSATTLLLREPQVHIGLPAVRKEKKAVNMQAIMDSMRPFLDVKQVEVSNGMVEILQPARRGKPAFLLNSVNAIIDVPKLLQSQQPTDLAYATEKFNAVSFIIDDGKAHIEFQNPRVAEDFSAIMFSKVKGSMVSPSVRFDLNNIHIVPDTIQLQKRKIATVFLPKVEIDNGSVVIALAKKIKAQHHKSNSELSGLLIDNLNASRLRLQIIKEKNVTRLDVVSIHANKLHLKEGNVLWEKLAVQAKNAEIAHDSMKLTAATIDLLQPGYVSIKNINLENNQFQKQVQLHIDEVRAAANYNSVAAFKSIHLQSLRVDRPLFTGIFNAITNTNVARKPSLPKMRIDTGSIINASMQFENNNNNKTIHFQTNTKLFSFSNLETRDETSVVYISRIQSHLDKPLFWQRREVPFSAANTRIMAHDIVFDVAGRKITGLVDSTIVETVSLRVPMKNDSLHVDLQEVGFANYKFNSADSLSKYSFFKHKNWWVKRLDIGKGGESELRVYNLNVNSNTSTAAWDSLSINSSLTRDSFWRKYPYEKAYLTVNMGRGRLNHFSAEWLPGEEKSVVHVRNMEVNNVFFMAEKDKTGLPDTVTYRPLLARSLLAIPFRVLMDTILINRSQVRYNEIAQKTNQEGHIYFSDVTGRITNVKNHGFAGTDSIRARLNGKLMGQGAFLFIFRQSYPDTLQGFNMTYQMSRFNMPTLNPFLQPVVSLQISQGISDSTWMRVKANDYTAYGLMDFRYSNLKLAHLKKGDQEYFLSGVVNRLINAIVRTNSNNQRDVIFQERLRNKAIYGYWGRIAISGLLTNLGVKKDKKQKRLYQKSIKNTQLPDYTNDFE